MKHHLSLHSISVRYSRRKEWVLDELALELASEEVLGITGRNGTGKSTLAHALVGIIPHINPGQVCGTGLLDGKELFNQDLDQRLQLIGYTFQDFASQILFGKVADAIAPTPRACREFLEQAAKILNVEPLLPRTPNELSGGEAQRVALLTALRNGPTVLIYDEATSALDPHGRLAFIELVKLFREQELLCVLLGQRPEVLSAYADRLLTLSAGRLVDSDVSESLVDCRKTASEFWEVLFAEFEPTDPQDLVLQSVTLDRRASNFSFGPIDLELKNGETVAVVGPNGSGKTTLFLTILGALKPKAGFFMVERKSFSPHAWRSMPSQVSFAPQSPLWRIIGTTVQEEFELALASTSQSIELLKGSIVEAFPFLDFSGDPLQLSFGQQRILNMLTSILSPHPIVIFDEPEQGLDSVALDFFKSWVRLNKARQWKTVVFSTHELPLAAELGERCVLLQNGRIEGQIENCEAEELESWYFQLT